MTMTHDDLNRSLGRVEGEMKAVKETLADIQKALAELRAELAELKASENQRKGAERFAMWAAGAIGGFVAYVTTLFFK